MSASLVRKSLLLVDSSPKTNQTSFKQKKRKTTNSNSNEKQIGKKLTVLEARKKFKSKEQILKENLKKIELIRKFDKVVLEKDIVNKIIERAVTRKPIKKIKKKSKKDKKTAFTEEDFKKFEEEYFDNEPL